MSRNPLKVAKIANEQFLADLNSGEPRIPFVQPQSKKPWENMPAEVIIKQLEDAKPKS